MSPMSSSHCPRRGSQPVLLRCRPPHRRHRPPPRWDPSMAPDSSSQPSDWSCWGGPGFGFNGSPYTTLYSPVLNYNTEFPQLGSAHNPLISTEHQPRSLPQHLPGSWTAAPSTPAGIGYGHPDAMMTLFCQNHVGARSTSALYLHAGQDLCQRPEMMVLSKYRRQTTSRSTLPQPSRPGNTHTRMGVNHHQLRDSHLDLRRLLYPPHSDFSDRLRRGLRPLARPRLLPRRSDGRLGLPCERSDRDRRACFGLCDGDLVRWTGQLFVDWCGCWDTPPPPIPTFYPSLFFSFCYCPPTLTIHIMKESAFQACFIINFHHSLQALHTITTFCSPLS